MGEKEGSEEDRTPKGRKREGDSEVMKTIATFIDEKFKNVFKEAEIYFGGVLLHCSFLMP